RKIFNNEYTEKELERFTWGDPVETGNISEQTFELLWADINKGLNLIFEMYALKAQDTDRPKYVVIGNGSCAKRKADGRWDTSGKKPDYAGYEKDPESNQYCGDGPFQVYNRIPGDAK